MKKFLSVGISLLMAGSLACLVACGDKESSKGGVDPVVNANWTTLSSTNLNTFNNALENVDISGIAGDISAKNYAVGANMAATLNASVSLDKNNYANVSLNANGGVSFAKNANSLYGWDAKGALEASAKASVSLSGELLSIIPNADETFSATDKLSTDIALEGGVYFDNSYVYVNGSESFNLSLPGMSTSTSSNLSVKVSTAEYMGELLAEVEYFIQSLEEMNETVGDYITDASLLEMQSYGLDVAYEYKPNSLKVKISYTDKNTVEAILEEMAGMNVTLQNDFGVAVYAVISNGALQQVSASIDVAGTIGGMGTTITLDISGAVKLTLGQASVQLPKDLSSYTDYTFILEELLYGGYDVLE